MRKQKIIQTKNDLILKNFFLLYKYTSKNIKKLK
jgi:hypothetical protein